MRRSMKLLRRYFTGGLSAKEYTELRQALQQAPELREMYGRRVASERALARELLGPEALDASGRSELEYRRGFAAVLEELETASERSVLPGVRRLIALSSLCAGALLALVLYFSPGDMREHSPAHGTRGGSAAVLAHVDAFITCQGAQGQVDEINARRCAPGDRLDVRIAHSHPGALWVAVALQSQDGQLLSVGPPGGFEVPGKRKSHRLALGAVALPPEMVTVHLIVSWEPVSAPAREAAAGGKPMPSNARHIWSRLRVTPASR